MLLDPSRSYITHTFTHCGQSGHRHKHKQRWFIGSDWKTFFSRHQKSKNDDDDDEEESAAAGFTLIRPAAHTTRTNVNELYNAT